jgi:flagellar biosynthetic protein FliS
MSGLPASKYQQASAHGASSIGFIVSLYDTVLRDFVRAQAALESGDVEARIFELNHALTVIAHLQSILNHGQGGEAAKRFKSFYVVTRAMILEASLQPSRQALEKLIEVYGSVRQAWNEIDQKPLEGTRSIPEPVASKQETVLAPQPVFPKTIQSESRVPADWRA